jgi:C-terminal peptidase prc
VLLVVALLAAPLLLGPAGPAAGQDAGTPDVSVPASPAPTPQVVDGRLDLAAMALDADDLPEGFVLQSESYTAGADWVNRAFPGNGEARQTISDAGLEWWYESTYGLPGTLLTIRTYVEQYADEEGARAGFEFLEDEAIQLSPNAPVEDFPIEGVESDQEELSVVDWEIVPGFYYRSIDATFRDGRVVAGVSFKSIGGTIPPERPVVEDLAIVLSVRVGEVLTGAAEGFADPTLAASLLPAGAATVTEEGYLSGTEVVPSALPAVAERVESGYVRTVGLPFPNAADTPPVLFVNLAVVRFASAEDAHAALYSLDDLTIPSPLPRPGESFRQQGKVPNVEGADTVGAVRRALLPGGIVDSARVGFVRDNELALVDVAGAASLAAAEAAAADLANRQAACLVAGGSCATQLPAADLQASALVTAPEPAPVDGPEERARVFDQVWRTIDDDYLYRTGRQGILFPNYHEVDWNAVRAEYEPQALVAASDEEFHRVVGEMVAELGDQHTGYLSPEDARADDALFAGEPVYVGIGALLAGGLDPANPGLVLYVFPGSPADGAGLQRRDRVLAVDGEAIAGADDERQHELLDAVDTLTAPDQAPSDAGPPVTLTVRSPGEGPREIEIERAVGPAPIQPIVQRLESNPSIAYVLIIDFVTPDLNDQIVAGLEALLAEGPISGVILDVRANPGGALSVTQQVLGQFVSGQVGSYYSRDGTPPEAFNVEPGALYDELLGLPLVVLTDDRMYSASEVTTSILQNEGRATVVGVTSPGDVEVLIPFDFEDGSRLYLAVQLFDLPGRVVEGQGVIPDVPVLEDWTRYPFADDPQIAAAVGVIQLAALEPEELVATPET